MTDPDASFHGVVIGVVTNNKDPEGLGRVKLTLPWLADDVETAWARIATPMAGKERGWYSLPEVDDEVLVAFEHGDPEFPYVLGALWNGKDKPPAANGDGKNDVRMLRSRSGHVIRLTDSDGAEKIEIIDGSARNSIVINTKDDTITIKAGADVVVEATGALKLSGRSVEIASSSNLAITAKAALKVESSAQLAVKGQIVQIN